MTLSHHARAMGGRDPHESHRAATPLELLYDLVFVVAFGVAGYELAHELAAGHVWEGIVGFTFCMFGVVLAWVSFTWFASAYDTDDWIYRLLTMVQMMGVALFSIGIPDIFESLNDGGVFHNEVIVAGYVVMRIALIAQFMRAANRDTDRRSVLSTYIVGWSIAQVGWIIIIFTPITLPWVFLAMAPLYLLELGVPWLAERRGGMPWHAHHVGERFGLLAIIALGEGVVGTLAALAALIEGIGWNVDTVLLLIAGLGVTFAMWWTYFILPFGELLSLRRTVAPAFTWLHYPVYFAIAAVGAGLHVVAYVLDPEHAGFEVKIGDVGTVVAVAVPVGLFVAMVFATYGVLIRSRSDHDVFHGSLLAGTIAVLVGSVVIVQAGAPVTVGILLAALAPVVTIVGYESKGHEHIAEDLETLRG